MSENRLELGAKEKVFALAADVQRLNAHAVACQNDPFVGFTPQSNREHATQAGKALFVPFEKGVQNGFGIGVRYETVPALFEFAPQFEMIVDFSVEDNSGVAILGENGLVPSVQVNDFETGGAHGK
jgi:hypothetical protein